MPRPRSREISEENILSTMCFWQPRNSSMLEGLRLEARTASCNMEDVFLPERVVPFHTSLGLYGYLWEDVAGRLSKAFFVLSLVNLCPIC